MVTKRSPRCPLTESLNVHLVLQSRPFSDSCDFDWIHGDFVLRDNQTQVLNPLLVELTLLWAKEKFVLFQDL